MPKPGIETIGFIILALRHQPMNPLNHPDTDL